MAPTSAAPSRWAVPATVVGLALGPAVGLGFARFGYTLLLPPMRSDLSWSFAEAGVTNAVNALGYLLGALVAARAATVLGARRAFLGGMVVAAVAMALSATSGLYWAILLWRLVGGAAGAVTFVVGGGIVAQLGAAHGRSRATVLLGVYFGGVAAGIALTGLVLPPVLSATGDHAGWRWGWLLLGVAGVAATAVAAFAARGAPDPVPAPPLASKGYAHLRVLAPVMVAYGLFGVGYISYMTFIVAFLAGEGAGAADIATFWVALGVAGIVGGFAWGPVLGRLRAGRGVALVTVVLAAGAGLPLLSRSTPVGLASAVLFGGSFLAVVTAVTAAARHVLEPYRWTPAIAALTVVFAAGQCVGPVLSGVLSDGPGGVRTGLVASVVVLLLGAAAALAQRDQMDTIERHARPQA